MDNIEAIRAFLAVAEGSSFTRAADVLGLPPSLVTKRVSQLEQALGVMLLYRTTRKVSLSADGEHHLDRLKATVRTYDETIQAIRRGPERLTGSLRMKVPLTLALMRLEAPLLQFAKDHPDVNLELLLLDGPLNPAAEGVDIAVTAFPATFEQVIDEFLWPLKRSLYASPDYLESHPPLEHPRSLDHIDALVYQPTGATWSFLAESGILSVTVNAKLSSNNMPMLVRAAEEGAGIGLFSDYVASDAVRRKSLVRIMTNFPVPDLWIKAMIPKTRYPLPRVQAALEMLKSLNLG